MHLRRLSSQRPEHICDNTIKNNTEMRFTRRRLTRLCISAHLRQLKLAADGVAAVGCDPTLNAFSAIVTEAHAAAVNGVDLWVCVQVSDTCDR